MYTQRSRKIDTLRHSHVHKTLSAVGLPTSEMVAACWWEGIVTNIFTLSAIFWTIDITLLLYSIIGFKRVSHSLAYVHSAAWYISISSSHIFPPIQVITISWWHHLLCWGVPIIVTLAPLINSTYGAPGKPNTKWRFLSLKRWSSHVWERYNELLHPQWFCIQMAWGGAG